MEKEGWFKWFYRKQITEESTATQDGYDFCVGMLLPIICLIADPIVFRDGQWGTAFFRRYVVFAYGFIGLQILALSYSVFGRKTFAWLGGWLIGGAIFSFILGFLLLPFTLIGLMLIVGILGLAPYFTGFVYLRNGLRMLNEASKTKAAASLQLLFIIGFAGSLFIPALAQYGVFFATQKYTNELLSNNETSRRNALSKLKFLSPIADVDSLLTDYESERDPQKKNFIADAYQQITGQNIEQRLIQIND
jgi:hypothetical protein